jgi:hypothetical protein
MAVQKRNLRTASEAHFEEYLTEQGLPFDYEKPYPGKSKRVDYTVPIDGRNFLFEVRELDPRRAGANCGIDLAVGEAAVNPFDVLARASPLFVSGTGHCSPAGCY